MWVSCCSTDGDIGDNGAILVMEMLIGGGLIGMRMMRMGYILTNLSFGLM